jgi:hypothetical protein
MSRKEQYPINNLQLRRILAVDGDNISVNVHGTADSKSAGGFFYAG